MGLSKLWAKDSDGSRGFVFSHVKTIYYNWAQKKLLSTKLDEIDALIDQKIAKAMMSNVQVNDQNKVPTSALAYAMQQQITENEEAITGLNSDTTFKARGAAQSRSDIDDMGMYELTGDKPGNGAYKALSFGKKGTDWNYPVIVGTQYGDNRQLYSYVMRSADGQNYSPTDYVALATMDEVVKYVTDASNFPDLTSLIEFYSTWNKPYMFGLDWASSLSPDGSTTVGIGVRGVIWAFTLHGGIYVANGGNPQWTEVVKPQQST